MLWAAIFFPWWLLRIFRDYCCDGILAMKNILLSMYDQSRGGPGAMPPEPTPTPSVTGFGVAMKIPKEVEVPVRVKLETVEEIKRARTEDISQSLNLRVNKLTDIARFETDRKTQQTVQRSLNFLQNPIKAETPTERQKFMNIRSELFSRAIKEDKTAKQILSSLSTSRVEQTQKREEMLKYMPERVPVTHIVSLKVKVPRERVTSITNSYITAISAYEPAVKSFSEKVVLQPVQVRSILSSLDRNLNQPSGEVVQNIVKETGVDKKKVLAVIQEFLQTVKTKKDTTKSIADKEKMKEEDIEKIMLDQIPLAAQPEKHVEKTISIPPSVSIEEYEQVKKMWKDQYERGEVPLSGTIKSRDQWVEQDVVFITNTLNKLVSDIPEIRQEGLDELGYILPIFLINNLKGDQLLVYLKAKLEAAKEAASLFIQKKEEVESTKVEEFVDVAKPKAEEKEKAAEMKEENS